MEQSIDGVLSIQTRDRSMVGTDKTTELCQPHIPLSLHLRFSVSFRINRSFWSHLHFFGIKHAFNTSFMRLLIKQFEYVFAVQRVAEKPSCLTEAIFYLQIN